jgi:hypothetical protein
MGRMVLFIRATIMICCKNKSIIIKCFLQKEHFIYFINAGFTGSSPYERGGLFYAENLEIILIAPFGTNKLSVYCKIKDCKVSIENVKNILISIGLL